MIQLTPISIPLVPTIWQDIAGWVKDALADDKSYTPDDIRNRCQTPNDLQLWVIFKDRVPTGFITTQIQPAPQGITVYAPLLGGENLETWVAEGLEQLKVWLRDIKSLSFSWVGRAAWKKLVKVDSDQHLYTINLG